MLYARQWCVSPDDALQEALIDLASQSQNPRDPIAWLFKTVRCKAINQARSEQRRSKHQNLAAEQRESWFTEDSASGIGAREIESLLSALQPLDREIVVARIWGELPFERVAELVDRSLSYVYRRYQIALRLLEKRIDGQVEKQS